MDVSEVKVSGRLRGLNPEKVQEIAESIRTIGLLNPITLSEDYGLISGLHRKSLGWTGIEARICSSDALRRELAEIDENLIRTDLTVLERGEHFKRRKEIYEELYPEAKAENLHPGHCQEDRPLSESHSERHLFT